MAKKVYRSLFDSDDVYEVEELTDEPEISTSGIAKVKTEDESTEVSMAEVLKVLNEIRTLLSPSKVGDNNPAEDNKVEKVDPEIDKSAPVNDEDLFEEEEISKDVKDSYSKFTQVSAKDAADTQAQAQAAFQKRYDAVANR